MRLSIKAVRTQGKRRLANCGYFVDKERERERVLQMRTSKFFVAKSLKIFEK